MSLSASLVAMVILSPGGSLPSAGVFSYRNAAVFVRGQDRVKPNVKRESLIDGEKKKTLEAPVFLSRKGMEESTRKSCDN